MKRIVRTLLFLITVFLFAATASASGTVGYDLTDIGVYIDLLCILPHIVLIAVYSRLMKKPPEQRKRLKIFLLIYCLVYGIGMICLLVSSGHCLSLLGSLLSVIAAVLCCTVSTSQEVLPLPNDPDAFRSHLRVRYATDMLFSWYLARDKRMILRFDHMRNHRQEAPVPKMWTYEGTQLWQHYVAVCMNDPVITEPEHKKQLIQAGGWRCNCGKTNPVYTSTCVCGKNKREVPLDVQTYQPPTPQKWRCSCGRENEGYVSTCVCGKSKREANEIT